MSERTSAVVSESFGVLESLPEAVLDVHWLQPSALRNILMKAVCVEECRAHTLRRLGGCPRGTVWHSSCIDAWRGPAVSAAKNTTT